MVAVRRRRRSETDLTRDGRASVVLPDTRAQTVLACLCLAQANKELPRVAVVDRESWPWLAPPRSSLSHPTSTRTGWCWIITSGVDNVHREFLRALSNRFHGQCRHISGPKFNTSP